MAGARGGVVRPIMGTKQHRAPRKLIPRPRRLLLRDFFVREYLKDLNGKQAAIRCGASPRSAESTASRWLRDAKVAAEVARLQAQQLERAELSASRVLEEMRRVALSNIRDYWTDGRLKQIGELSEEQGAALASLEVLIKNAEAGDGKTDLVHKIKLWDKVRALELLAKHFKLLTDIVQVDDEEARLARLDAGRRRNAERRQS